MNLDFDVINNNAFVLVPLVIALVQGVKMTGWVQSKFAPLVSLAFGILVSFIANHDAGDMSNSLLHGITYGLMASGLFSGVKTMAHANNNPNGGTKGKNGNQFV